RPHALHQMANGPPCPQAPLLLDYLPQWGKLRVLISGAGTVELKDEFMQIVRHGRFTPMSEGVRRMSCLKSRPAPCRPPQMPGLPGPIAPACALRTLECGSAPALAAPPEN